MNFGDLMGLFVAMGGMVAIVAVIGNSYRHRLAHKLRLAELRALPVPTVNADQQAELVERLEHRIRVLERIAPRMALGRPAEFGLRGRLCGD